MSNYPVVTLNHVEVITSDQVQTVEAGPRTVARQAFRDAELRLAVVGRAISQNLDKRSDNGFAESIKQATYSGFNLDEQDKADILRRRDSAQADFSARQSAMHERLVTAVQHLAMNDIACVSDALDKASDAMSALSANPMGGR